MEEIVFLILTIIIEMPVALIFLRKEDWRRVVLVVLGVNMISHPIVWQLLFHFGMNWFVAEICVALFEGMIFGLIFKDRRMFAVFTGIFMNIVSAAVGFISF